MLECLRSPLFKGPKGGKQWAERLQQADAWLKNKELERWFDESVRLVEAAYRNHQPFYAVRKKTMETRGKDLNATVDVAARLYLANGGRKIWKVAGKPQLDFRFLDREIQIVRTKPD